MVYVVIVLLSHLTVNTIIIIWKHVWLAYLDINLSKDNAIYNLLITVLHIIWIAIYRISNVKYAIQDLYWVVMVILA